MSGEARDSRKVLVGSSMVFASRLAGFMLMLVFSIYMARTLGRDIYGLISISLGVFGIMTIVGDLGVTTASARRIAVLRKAGGGPSVRQILASTLVVKAVTGTAVGILVYAMAPALGAAFDKPVEPLFRLMAAAILLNLLGSSFQSVMRGMHRMGIFALSNAVRDVLWVMFAIAFVELGWGVEGAVLGFLVGQVVWFAVNLGLYMAYVDVPGPVRPAPGLARELLAFGLPLIVADLMIFVYSWTATFVLGVLRPTWEVSTYNIAFGMVSMVMVVVSSVGMTVFPIFSERSVSGSVEEMEVVYRRLIKFMCVAVFPLLSFIAVLAPYVVLMYGKEYRLAVAPLLVLVVWGYLSPVSDIGSRLLTAMERQRYVMYSTALVAALNLALNIALIPRFGMMGAAAASTASFVLSALLVAHYLRSLHGIRSSPGDVAVPFAVSVGMAVPFYFILGLVVRGDPPALPTVLILGSAMAVYLLGYVLALRALRYFDDQDLDSLHHATAKVPVVREVLPALFPLSGGASRCR